MSLRRSLASLLLALAALLPPCAANAQVFRAYLSAHGTDNPACSLAAPCRLLPAALGAVADGGEIWMLDSANYNSSTVFVFKSVTILAVPGALGSLVAAGGSAIWVDAPGVNVVLRNLVIVPLPGAGAVHGVQVSRAAAITVDNCLIANMPFDGISVRSGVAVRVIDSTIRGNSRGIYLLQGPRATIVRSTVGANTGTGIYVDGGVGPVNTTAEIADSTLDANQHGLWAFSNDPTATVSVSIRESRVVRNLSLGVVSQSQGGPVMVSASNNLIASHPTGVGLDAGGAGARMWAAGNMVTGNHTGIQSSAGAIFESAGNNAVRGNTTFQSNGTITLVAPR